MKLRTVLFSLFLSLAFVLTACGGPIATPEAMMSHDTATPDAMMQNEATSTPDTMMMHETPTPDTMMMHDTATPDTMMMHETPTPDAMMTQDAMSTPGAMMEPPAWFSAQLTEAHSGQPFNIQDFSGKVVLVESMAVWCTNCLAQQQQIKDLHTAMGMRDDFVSVSLDIDPNENTDVLKAYLAKTGFDWKYAVASVDVAREIGKLYGDQFLNPPSTPILIIDRHGEAHPLPFGIKSADDLMKAVQPYLDGSM